MSLLQLFKEKEKKKIDKLDNYVDFVKELNTVESKGNDYKDHY